MAITNFIPTIWSESLLQALNQKYIGVANCNREFEGEIREKGSKVRICGVDTVTIGTYTKNTNISTPETLSDSYKELAIDQAKYFNFQIDDVDRAQSLPRLMEAALRNAANALAGVADQYVYSVCAQSGQSLANASVTADNVLNTLIDARTMLLKQNVTNPSDIVIEVSPDIAGLILKAKMNLATDNAPVLEQGCIGSIGGCKIYVSSNISSSLESTTRTYECIARTRRAVAYAEQLSEIEAYRPELRFADAVKGLHLYGAKIVYPTEIVVMSLGVSTT